MDNRSKSLEDRLEIIPSLGIIVVGSFIVSIFGGFSLSEEVEWYKAQGFEVKEHRYDDFIATFDKNVLIDEHKIRRDGVREQSKYIFDKYGIINIFYDVDEKIIFFIAHWSQENQKAMIFSWKASYP